MTGDQERDSALSGVTPDTVRSTLTAVNETTYNDNNTSGLSLEFTRSLQGFIARPANSLEKSLIRSTTIPVVRTADTMKWTGPGLNATGSDVAMETLQIQTETLAPI